jgi:hypothetical protein
MAEAAAFALQTLESSRVSAKEAQIRKIDTELDKLVPDLSFDMNKDGQVTTIDFLEDGELTPSAAMKLGLYYSKQPPKEGQKKDNTTLMLAGAILIALYGTKKVSDVVKNRPPSTSTTITSTIPPVIKG